MSRGIVVLGAPRSGTTLLRALLDAHPAICAPPETYLMRACARFLEHEPFGDGLQAGVVDALSFSGVGEDEVIGGLRDFAFGILDRITARAGKAVWADKTAYDVFHVDAVERMCGDDVKYVLMFRHGLDVAISTVEKVQQMNRWIAELHRYVAADPRPLHACTAAWVDATARMLQLEADRPEQCVRLRYEDLVADPEAELTRILGFLGYPTDVAALVERGVRTATPGFGDWKGFSEAGVSKASVARYAALDPTTRGELAELANPLLVALGYDAVKVPAKKSAGRARRQLELGLLAARMKAGDPEP
ncbi:MAG: sulfotransferase [Alphaproteobacteria bacterium]|nr:sulfotransferase [Alphaproteobacteria bacterium]